MTCERDRRTFQDRIVAADEEYRYLGKPGRASSLGFESCPEQLRLQPSFHSSWNGAPEINTTPRIIEESDVTCKPR